MSIQENLRQTVFFWIDKDIRVMGVPTELYILRAHIFGTCCKYNK